VFALNGGEIPLLAGKKKILEQFDHQFCGIQFVSAKTLVIL
jgi:hypothetical protein